MCNSVKKRHVKHSEKMTSYCCYTLLGKDMSYTVGNKCATHYWEKACHTLLGINVLGKDTTGNAGKSHILYCWERNRKLKLKKLQKSTKRLQKYMADVQNGGRITRIQNVLNKKN